MNPVYLEVRRQREMQDDRNLISPQRGRNVKILMTDRIDDRYPLLKLAVLLDIDH